MRKKLLTILLTVTISLQISVPLGMLFFKSAQLNMIKEKGEIYTFSAFRPDFYDNRLSARIWTTGASKRYVIIDKDLNGKVVFINSEEKPDTTNYIDRYTDSYQTTKFGVFFPEVYIKTDKYSNLEHIIFQKKLSANYQTQEINGNIVLFNEVSVNAYVYNGKMYIENIYIDSIAAETYLEQLNEKMK